MDVRLPNGYVIQGVPEGTTKTEVMRRAVSAGLAKYEDFADKSDPMLDPTTSFAENAAAGAGKAVADLGRGVRQIGANLGMGDSATIQREIDESRQRDAPLMASGGGFVGNIAGNVALTVAPGMALGAVPKAGALSRALLNPDTYKAAAGVGAGMGALMPIATGESRILNTGLGALGGAAGKFIGDEVIGRIFRPVQSELPAAKEALAREAAQEGIPLDAAQRTGSRALAYLDSAMDSIPATGARQAAKKQTQQEAFTTAALRRAGIDASEASPDILNAQFSALGRQFEDIAGRNAIDFNQPGVVNSLADVADEASRRLAGNNAEVIGRTVDDILNDVDANGVMAGTKYQGWREKLRPLAKGNDTTAHFYGQVKRALDDAFHSQVTGADSEAWKTASRQYANLKTIASAMGGAGEAAATNQISPAQLAQALRQAVGREGRARGRGDLDSLARIGAAFLKPVPSSGTAERQLAQAILTGGGVGGAAYMATQDPATAAKYAAGGIGGTMLFPRLAQALIESQGAQNYLTSNITKNAGPSTRRLLEALRQAAVVGGASSLPELVNSQ